MAIVRTLRVGLCAAALLVGALAATPARSGETTCWFEHGAIVVAAAFGDMTGDFIFDLSAPSSQIHLTTAQAHGVQSTATVADLTLAGETIRALPTQVVDLDQRSTPFATNIVGVLGADVGRRFVVEIRFAPCRLALRERHGRVRDSAKRLAIRWMGGVPAVRASVCDDHRCESGWFAIDTASQGVRLTGAALSRPLAEAAALSRSAPPARLRGLSIAGRLFEQTPAGLMDAAPPGITGAIGDAVWSNYRVTLDAGRGWLELAEPAKSDPRGAALMAGVAPNGAIAAVEKAGEDNEEDHYRQP